jgi:hypothetical protein
MRSTTVVGVMVVGLGLSLPAAGEEFTFLDGTARTFTFESGAESGPYAPALPEGAVGYESARYTQEIATTNDIPRITPFPIRRMSDTRWHQPGGLLGVPRELWRAEKYRTLPSDMDVGYRVLRSPVLNSFGFYQQELSIRRAYPDGTRFDEVLVNAETDRVFEHRVREKHDGEWYSDVVYRDVKQRPRGYQPVSVEKCASCHDEAGTGKYAEGMVPGGDGVLSDPLDWSSVRGTPAQYWYDGHNPEGGR